MKKILSVIICFLLLTVAFVMSVSAETVSGSCGTSVTYTLDKDSGVLTLSGSGKMDSYSTYTKVPWYTNKNYVKTVVVEEGITYLGQRAFYECINLKSVSLPDTLTTIDLYAFVRCSGLESIVIPNSVTKIGNAAFRGCSSLKEISIPYVSVFGAIFGKDSYTGSVACYHVGAETTHYLPASLEKVTITGGVIPEYAFCNCTMIKEVVIDEGVTEVEWISFVNCTSLSSVTIHPSVTNIWGSVFADCPSDLTIYCHSGSAAAEFAKNEPHNAVYMHFFSEECEIAPTCTAEGAQKARKCVCGEMADVEGIIPALGHDMVMQEAKEPTADTVGWESYGICSRCGYSDQKIYHTNGNSGFVFDIATSTLTISGDVEPLSSNEKGYYYLWSEYGDIITSVIVENATTIGKSAFWWFDKLTSVELSDGLKNIERGAFFGCSSLQSITIPSGVKSISDNAFGKCEGLVSIIIPDSVESIGAGAFSYCYSLQSVVIPNGVKSIGENAFEECEALANMEIPGSVENIGAGAFFGCSSLQSITIPAGVTCIEEKTFKYCSSLTNIEIPDSVTRIGRAAFDGCTSLENITIPAGVENIEAAVFYGCSSLTGVELPNGITSVEGCLFWGCESIVSIVIPQGVKTIGEGAFENCSSLVSITIPDSVESIEAAAFAGCITLANITIPDRVESIGTSAFECCSSLTSITIPNSVKTIGSYAFGGCSKIESIVIPDSVTEIGSCALRGWSNLKEIVLPFGCIFGELFGKSEYTNSTKCVRYYYDGYYLKEDIYYIPSGLEKVTIKSGYVPFGAFYNCKMIKDVVLCDGVTSIDGSGFRGCSALTSLTVPASVTYFGDNVLAAANSCVVICYKNSDADAFAIKNNRLRRYFGDLDGDGELKVSDALASLAAFGDDEVNAIADMNGDSVITLLDIIKLLKVIVE